MKTLTHTLVALALLISGVSAQYYKAAASRDYLLVQVPNATAAYTVDPNTHPLAKGAIWTVQRDGDEAEADFTAAEIADGTLAAWVTAGGAPTDGYLKTWHDVSSTAGVANGNDATQATRANQPLVVSSGTLVTENGKPAVDFDGSTDYMLAGDIAWSSYAVMASSWIATPDATNATQAVIAHYDFGNSQRSFNPTYFTNSATLGAGVSSDGGATNLQFRTGGVYASNTQYLVSYQYDGSLATASQQQAWQNSSAVSLSADSDSIATLHNSTAQVSLGSLLNNGAADNLMNGTIQTAIIYNFDQSTARPGIENWLNTFFSVY